MKRWIISDKSKLEKEEDIIAVLLKNRAVKTKKEIEDFLNPRLDQLTYQKVGLDIGELDKAVKRIRAAIKNKESIIVYTDYDVDGVSSGAIVWEALFRMGADVMPYVPHRVEEGYGLSETGIDKIHKENQAKLIITVDHGVTGKHQIDYAKKLGIDVIIIDHHTLPDDLPKAHALIHTTALCATGVAWFFVNFLKQGKLNTDDLDLVALATIADMIPLIGVNRILVKYGLEALNNTKRLGLVALIENSGLKLGDLGVYEVGHMLSPRINASGRLTHALDSLRLLCTKDENRAAQLADNLSSTNRDRQLMLEETVIHAKETAKLKVQNSKLIMIAEEKYNQGIIGLVAGKLVEEFYRPAIVVSIGDKYSKASARSVSGFNIVEAIRRFSDLLVDVGGHPMAAGFTIETSKLLIFEKKLVQFAQKELKEENLERVLKIDCEINLDLVNEKFYKRLKTFEPFGVGNPEPTFISKHVKVVKMRLIGKDKKHLKLTLQPDIKFNHYIEAIGFGLGNFYSEFALDKLIDIVYTVQEDSWNKNRNWTDLNSSLQLKLKDVKISES